MKANFYQHSLKSLLFEQEETEETAEEETEEAAEEEGGEGAEDDADDGGEEQVQVSTEPTLDSEIEAVLIDFETSARKSAVSESSDIRLIYEVEEELDLDSFTADVARLVKNYDNLIDMEALLVNKSKDFIGDRYGEEAVSQFVDKLEKNYDIEEPKDMAPIPSVSQTPFAVGAGAAGE